MLPLVKDSRETSNDTKLYVLSLFLRQIKKEIMKLGYVISDLHYFSCRSQFELYRQVIFNKTAEADILVLNGDIFDFRWSQLNTQDSVKAATSLLRELISANSSCEFKYLPGNHDSIPEFTRALEKLADENLNFSWHAYHLHLDKIVFLHGDILLAIHFAKKIVSSI